MGWGWIFGGTQLRTVPVIWHLFFQVTLNSAALLPPDTHGALDIGNANEGKAFLTELCGLGKGPGADVFCLLHMLKVYKKKNQADSPSPCHAWWDLTPSQINSEMPAALRGGRISPRNVIWTLVQEHIPVTPEALQFTDQKILKKNPIPWDV